MAGLGVNISLLIPAATKTDITEAIVPVPDAERVVGLAPHPGLPSPLPDFPFMMSADEVAERAIAGLRKNSPIIVTHAAMRPLVEDYFRRILEAYDEAARFVPKNDT